LLFLALLVTVLSASEPAATPGALELGERLLARKQYAPAERELRRAVEADPSSARAHGNLALALLPQRKVGEAVAEARLAAAFGPTSAEAHFIFGMALAADRKPLDAMREYERAVELAPGAIGPISALAAAYAAAEDPRTVATYQKVAALSPADPSVPADLAEYLWRVERVEEGNAAIERALAAFPSNADLRLRWGRSLAQQERFADAAEALEAARRLGADDAATLALLADVTERAGRVEDARATLVAAVTRYPQDPALAHALGRLWLAEGKTEEALPPLEKAALARPSAAEFQLDYGRALEASGRTADAEAAYRKAIALSPNMPAPHFALGRLLQREGKKEEAQKELAMHHALYERGRRLVSAADVQDAQTSLAWTLLREGNAAEALERFRALPETPESLRGQAAALQRLGRPADAVRALERAHDLAPEDARIALLLATERSRAAEPKP
jgi:Flp pilus assembly protein TadD